jgi:hypothetical protein
LGAGVPRWDLFGFMKFLGGCDFGKIPNFKKELGDAGQ